MLYTTFYIFVWEFNLCVLLFFTSLVCFKFVCVNHLVKKKKLKNSEHMIFTNEFKKYKLSLS